LKYLSNKKGFLGTDNKSNNKEKVVIIPFGLEKTVSYGGGTSKGPKEIIKASHQVELYDEELNCEPYKKIGIKTLKPFKINKDIKFSSDFIVGYPGETESDFENTIILIKKISFVNSYSFIFSPRPGTPAAEKQLINLTESKKRLKKLQNILENLNRKNNKKYLQQY